MAIEPSHGQRVYGWWARHPGLYGLMTSAALLGRKEALRERAVERLQLRPGQRTLDLGCGRGANLELLQRAVGAEGAITALDSSEEMLAGAAALVRRWGWGNVELVHADAARAELPARSLDAALATLALSAIPDHREAIRRVRHALVPGGRFVVLDSALFPRGPLRSLNPLLARLFAWATNWDFQADLPAELDDELGAVTVEHFNLGTCFIAVARAE